MSYRKYDHNVDIRSTQLANAGRSLVKGAKELYLGIVGAALIGTAVLWIIVAFIDIDDRSKGVKRLIFSDIVNANKNNEVRADEEWMGRYLKYSGKVTNITRSSVYLENNYYEVVCKIGWFKGEPLKSLNKGDRITISGRNMESTDFIVNYKTVYLQNCEIL
tara:strand:- start:109 stop:594 length:486 start_codon:yes stop_codon:yes gene_type:complete